MSPTIESRKVLVVLPHLKIGGAQRQALLLTKELISRGISVRVVLVGLEGDRAKRDYETLGSEFGLDDEIIMTAGSAALDRLILGIVRSAKLKISTSTESGFTLGSLFSVPRVLFDSFHKFRIRSRALAHDLFHRARESWFMAKINQKLPSLVTRSRVLAHTMRKAHRVLRALMFRGGLLVLSIKLRKAIFSILAKNPKLLENLEKKPSLLLRAHYIESIMSREHPDMIISFLTETNLSCLIAGYLSPVPILISERNDVVLQPVSPHVSALRAALYTRAEIITANSPSGKKTLDQWFPGQEVRLMANDFPKTIKRRPLETKKVGVVCRLEKQKNVDLIIRGFVKSGIGERGWRLEIWGEGPELESLVETIKTAHASQTVHLMGVTKNPLKVMGEIDFLVAASSYEGSSNSIHEAVSAGAVPLFSNSIAEMTSVLPSVVRKTLGFQPDPDEISETLRHVTSEIFRESDVVNLLRDNFEHFWEVSRVSRVELLREIADILGFESPDNGNLTRYAATRPRAPQHLPAPKRRESEVNST